MHRCVERGGVFRDINQGISRGCPISPLLGAFFLTEIDRSFDQRDLFYIRYMDDLLILTKKRWALRRAVKQLNILFNNQNLEQHPDKTFIGRIEKGFDFLGYHFSRKPLRIAEITVKKHVERLYRLYEQQKNKIASSDEMALVLGDYVKRWLCWCVSGLCERAAKPLSIMGALSIFGVA